MVEENANTGRKVRQWALGAIGTLVVGLGAAWVLFFFGPRPEIEITPSDPCSMYEPMDPKYLKELMDQGEEDVGPDAAGMRPLIQDAIEKGHFLSWVMDCGKVQGVYEHGFSSARYRVSVSTLYQDRDGGECQDLYVNTRTDGRWSGSSESYCRSEGSWIQKPVD